MASPAGRAFVRSNRNVFRVLSYNILAEKFDKAHASYCPQPFLAWSYRSRLMLEEIVQYKADIVSLQEVQSSVYENHVKPFFRAIGYESFYCGRGLAEAEDYGVVLLFNSERLSCQACRTIRFRDVLDDWWPPAGDEARKSSPFWQQLRAVDEGAVVALLHSAESDKTICAVATHIHWDPSFPDVKAAQTGVVCQQMAKFVRDKCPPGRSPAFLLMGDLNSLWRKYSTDAWDRIIPSAPGYMTSGVYEMLHTGQLPKSHPDHPFTRRADNSAAQAPFTSGGLMLRSLHFSLLGHEPPVTNRTDKFAGCLDYVFFSPAEWTPLTHLGLPYEYEAENDAATKDPMRVLLPPLPNRQFPSDHLPIGGDLFLT